MPKKKRTLAEKRADDQRVADSCAAKEVAIEQAIEQVGDLESKMASDQVVATAPAKPVRPGPRQYRAKGNKGECNPYYNLEEDIYQVLTHQVLCSLSKQDPAGDPMDVDEATAHPPVKPTSQCLREHIDGACELKGRSPSSQSNLQDDSARASEKMKASQAQELFVHSLPLPCYY